MAIKPEHMALTQSQFTAIVFCRTRNLTSSSKQMSAALACHPTHQCRVDCLVAQRPARHDPLRPSEHRVVTRHIPSLANNSLCFTDCRHINRKSTCQSRNSTFSTSCPFDVTHLTRSKAPTTFGASTPSCALSKRPSISTVGCA